MVFTTGYTAKMRKIFYRFFHALEIIVVDKDNINHYIQNIYMLY